MTGNGKLYARKWPGDNDNSGRRPAQQEPQGGVQEREVGIGRPAERWVAEVPGWDGDTQIEWSPLGRVGNLGVKKFWGHEAKITEGCSGTSIKNKKGGAKREEEMLKAPQTTKKEFTKNSGERPLWKRWKKMHIARAMSQGAGRVNEGRKCPQYFKMQY